MVTTKDLFITVSILQRTVLSCCSIRHLVSVLRMNCANFIFTNKSSRSLQLKFSHLKKEENQKLKYNMHFIYILPLKNGNNFICINKLTLYPLVNIPRYNLASFTLVRSTCF
jgi:hypothetical protein